jgi:predicted esterase
MNVRVWLSRGIAVAVLVPVAVLVWMGVHAPWSLSGWIVLAALGLAAAAAFVPAPGRRRLLRALAGTAIAMVVIVRVLASTEPGGMPTLPGATSSRWLGRIVDEQDVSLIGARLLAWRWPLARDEREGLLREMRAAYVEMRDDANASPSPVLDTALGRQRPEGFDTLVFEAEGYGSGTAVVFLHGYGGSFRLECWLVARAARAINAITVCPATGFSARWGGRDGERTLRATLEYLHARGIRRVYLAGLSNGAAGASALAPKFTSSLVGLILISGAPADGTTAGLPALVIQGEHDPMASAAAARAFAARTHASYVGLDGGHFGLLMRRGQARNAIEQWLRQREAFR